MRLSFARVALHLLLVASLLVPGFGWAVELVAAPTASVAADAMPCHGNMPSQAIHRHPPHVAQLGAGEHGSCCPHAGCDLSACIATGALPRFAALPGTPAAPVFTFPWRLGVPPAARSDTLLRPPIA